MKTAPLPIALLAVSIASLAPAEAELRKIWETDPVLKVPESVLHDAQRGVLYVSNIDGKEPWGKDGKGSIAKLSPEGDVIATEWVSGLDAPKGMGLDGDRLYVTDLHDIVAISISEGRIVERTPVPDADKINDLSVAEDGTIYLTDSGKGIVYSLKDGAFETLVEGRKGLNGVLHSQGELFFLDSGALYQVSDDGTIEEIASGMEGHTDGVERVDDDSWLVSCWAGTVYYVTREGEVTLLLDRREQEISAADLGYDAERKIAYFPGFWANTVAAYQLELGD